jgi:hypothetical protein
MNLNEAKNLGKAIVRNQFSLSKISHPQFLWHCDYWDGPLSGICVHQDKRYWFHVVDEIDVAVNVKTEQTLHRDDYETCRIFLYSLVELTEEELKKEEYWHDLFEQHVGTHTNYDENNRRIGKVKPQENWNIFYEKAKAEHDARTYDENKVIAYFYSFEFDLDILLKEAE